MIKLISHFNERYDELGEPWRFLLFMFWMALAIIPLTVGLEIGSTLLALGGLVLLTIACIVGMDRAFNFSDHKFVGYAMTAVMIIILLSVVLAVTLRS